jgi:hypothetical protein
MKVCAVCNEIVAADQGCARSDCPNQIRTTTDPALKVDPGFTGKADRFVQAGLDGADSVARETTRRAFFALATLFAALIVVTIFALQSGNEAPASVGTYSERPATSPSTAVAANNDSIPSNTLSAETDLRAMSCDQLWHARNMIYAEKGQCFKTQRAVAAFGARCYPPYGELTQPEKIRVSEIRYWEGQAGCNLN